MSEKNSFSEFLTAEQIEAIQKAIQRGNDIAIQRTKNGFRIVEKRCKVISVRDTK